MTFVSQKNERKNKRVFGKEYWHPQYFGWAYRKYTEKSGTVIELVPNLTGMFGGVLGPYRTLLKNSAGY